MNFQSINQLRVRVSSGRKDKITVFVHVIQYLTVKYKKALISYNVRDRQGEKMSPALKRVVT